MFDTVLIANRGEIALRILRACRGLGLKTVVAHSEADRDASYVAQADQALCIGPSAPGQSYLNQSAILFAAEVSGAQAIHPGYGFLSENAGFAARVEQAGLVFIGPSAACIRTMGDKVSAKRAMRKAGVPCVPGPDEALPQEPAAIQAIAREIGYPVIVKAAGGGGGRGMKLVEQVEDLAATMDMASAEAEAAFGDARVYLERYVRSGRHIEVQVLGDGEGRVNHLGERDCSVQRRYQKLVEETPAPHLPPATRAAMHQAATRFAARLSYRGAGTVEFLYDVPRDTFYFLEMNARIQVEHPVTEAVTGTDLIAEQIAIAEGRGLRLAQADITCDGAAIECRINAEDPARDFAPSPGTVSAVHWPAGEGIRVDTHIVDGATIPPFYDSMIAKVIAHGPDRGTALARLRAALAGVRIAGVATNLAFQQAVLADPDFAAGGVDTGFLARFIDRATVAA
jgi:acetyl-CoA carboxylase biotin carboxylase subunit